MKNYNAVKRNCKIYDYLTLGYKNKFMALRKAQGNGSTANNATVVNKYLYINYLSLGVYFRISVLLQYFSLNPA